MVTRSGVTRGSATKLLTVALAHRGCCPCSSALSLPNYVSERFPFDANRPGKALQNKPEKDAPARTVCPQLGVMPLLMGWGQSSASPSTSVQLCLELLGSTPSPVLWDNL